MTNAGNAKLRCLAAALFAWWTTSCSAGFLCFPVASPSSSLPSTPVSRCPRLPLAFAFAFGPFATQTNPPPWRARTACCSRARRAFSLGDEASPTTTVACGTKAGPHVGVGFDDGSKVKDDGDAVLGRRNWAPRPRRADWTAGKAARRRFPSATAATATDRQRHRRGSSGVAEGGDVTVVAGWKRSVPRRATTCALLAAALLSTSLVLLGGIGGVSDDADATCWWRGGGFGGDDGRGGRERCVVPPPFVGTAAAAQVAPPADVGVREFLVKDADQLLRLSLPTSLPMSSDPEAVGDTGRAGMRGAGPAPP